MINPASDVVTYLYDDRGYLTRVSVGGSTRGLDQNLSLTASGSTYYYVPGALGGVEQWSRSAGLP